MKELSIEEKAKAYDKLFVKAQQIYNKENDALILHTLEDLFPELKENEDEMIRKNIIAIFKGEIPYTSEEDAKRYIAWLEKQGEKDKPTYNTYSKDVKLTQEEYDKKRVSDEATIKEVEAYKKGLEDAKKIFEKQREKKPFEMKSAEESLGIDSKTYNKIVYECVYGDDKVEPKFKVGDWIVKNDSGIGQHIKEIVNVNDETLYVFDEDEVLDVNFQEQYHLWTIQDAKDGDVLAIDSRPFIYNGSKNEVTVGAYCGFNTKHSFSFAYNYTINQNITPATKEQRDLLFQKMKEKGYEWDAEKKELKKIEQEPAWSEEDIRNIENIDSVLFYDKDLPEDICMKLRNWLKSLKPQNKWKPRDEQMKRLKGVINSLPHQEVLYSLYQDLKKLREE